MFKKIRSSLSAKVFLWITGLLALCCVLIYGLVMLFLPESYTVVTTSRVGGGYPAAVKDPFPDGV